MKKLLVTTLLAGLLFVGIEAQNNKQCARNTIIWITVRNMVSLATIRKGLRSLNRNNPEFHTLPYTAAVGLATIHVLTNKIENRLDEMYGVQKTFPIQKVAPQKVTQQCSGQTERL